MPGSSISAHGADHNSQVGRVPDTGVSACPVRGARGRGLMITSKRCLGCNHSGKLHELELELELEYGECIVRGSTPEGILMTVKLDLAKLLGFRISSAQSAGAKTGVKVGMKAGAKVGSKPV